MFWGNSTCGFWAAVVERYEPFPALCILSLFLSKRVYQTVGIDPGIVLGFGKKMKDVHKIQSKSRFLGGFPHSCFLSIF